MPVPKRRHSKARRDRARTHKKLAKPVNLTECPSCKAPQLPHRACPECGFYKGSTYKVVVSS